MAHLIRDHEHSLEAEPATAVVEQIFQRGSQELHDQCVVGALYARPYYLGDAGCTTIVMMQTAAT